MVIYPLLLGIIYSLWCEYKYKNILKYNKCFNIFICSYIGIIFLSLFLGLLSYPFYNEILNCSTPQIEKLPKLVSFLTSLGISVNKQILLSFWIFIRYFKAVFFEILYTVLFSYMIYCWYYDEWKRAYKVLMWGILSAIVVIFCYSFILEIPYLAGNKVCKELLVIINPYLHNIMIDGKWWPPLLWDGQLRSIFPEPSHFGIYSAFIMPFIWVGYFKSNNKIYLISSAAMSFLIFLTGARTAVCINIGQIILLCFIGIFFYKNKEYFYKFTALLVCTFIGFIFCNFYLNNYISSKKIVPSQKISIVQKSKPQKEKEKVSLNVKFNDVNNKEKTNITLKKATVKIKENVKKDDNERLSDVKLVKTETKFSDNIFERYLKHNILSVFNIDSRSNRARFSVMEADFKLGLDHPLLGVGNGLRNSYIPDYLSDKAKENAEVKMWLYFRQKLGILKSGFPTLGEYTVRFGETGILGLLCFIAPMGVLINLLIKRLKENTMDKRYEYVAILVSMIGVMVSGIGDSINIFHSVWILLGLGYAMCLGQSDS